MCRLRSRAEVLQTVSRVCKAAELNPEEQSCVEAAFVAEGDKDSAALCICRQLLQSGTALQRIEAAVNSLQGDSGAADSGQVLQTALGECLEEALDLSQQSKNSVHKELETAKLDSLIRSVPCRYALCQRTTKKRQIF